jgi:ribosomal protein L11 methyltransferase
MRWARVSVRTNPNALEAVAAALECRGTGGTLFESGPCAVGYLPVDDRLEHTLDSLKAALKAMPDLGIDPSPAGISLTFEEDVDWATAWREHFKPLHVSARLTICPSWEEYSPSEGEMVISLDPGMAFGTGGHETTRLCMRALESVISPGCVVADVGSGSGVLAITAALLGASRVDAVDNDPVAVETARGNVAQNGVADSVAVTEGDGLTGLPGPYDVVVANILPNVVSAMAPTAFGRLRPGGVYLASGFTEPYEADVQAALIEAGFMPAGRWTEGRWVALSSTRPNESA